MDYSGLYFFLCLQIELAHALSSFLYHEKINNTIFRKNWWRNLNSVNFSNNSQQQHSSNLYLEFIFKEKPKLLKQFIG